jgi:hypothetical protein
MEYEKELRETGEYTEIEIQEKMLINCLKSKLMKHHELYRVPVTAGNWEDIWDQCINPRGSNWIGGGHQSGADTIDRCLNISYQNKSGQIEKGKTILESMNVKDLKNLAKNHGIKPLSKLKKSELISKLIENGENNEYIKKEAVTFTSHRTSTYETLDDKINFITKKHCDKYVLLSRKKEEWSGNRPYIYYLMIFDASKIDLSKDSLEWNKKGNKYEGTNENKPYHAWINGPKTSDQLNITINIDYIGGYTKIIIP